MLLLRDGSYCCETFCGASREDQGEACCKFPKSAAKTGEAGFGSEEAKHAVIDDGVA
jgi:hypothetical protein